MDKRNLVQTTTSTLIALLLFNCAASCNQAIAQMGINLNLQADIEFDQNVITLEPITSYLRDDNKGGAREDLKFSPDGTFIAIGGMESSRLRISTGGRIELWHVESGKQTILSDGIQTFINPTFFPIAFSADSKKLAAADIGGEIKIWELSHSPIAEPKTLRFHDEERNTSIASSLCFTPDGNRIFVGAYPTRQLDVITGEEIKFFDKYADCLLEPNVIDFSPDGKLIAFGKLDSGINLLDRDAATITFAFRSGTPFKQIFFHQFLPSGNFHLTAGSRRLGSTSSVVVTERSTRNFTSAIALEDGDSAVAVSADGSMLAILNARVKKTKAYMQWRRSYREKDYSRSYPKMISLWKIADGKPKYLAQFSVASDEFVRAIALSLDGSKLVTSGANLRFWDVSDVRKE
jgi:WD40 repeat protein